VNAAELSSIAGVILSLAMSYIPGLSDWYNRFDSTKKSGIMALLLLIVTLGVFGLACGKVLAGATITCDKAGALSLIEAFIAALIANQATFVLSPRKSDPTRQIVARPTAPVA